MSLRVSQRLDHALRALVALARRPAGAVVPAGELADELGLPRRFVEQQFAALARAGIVACRRGAGGGCSLARPADAISVADVVVALYGSVLDAPRRRDSAAAEVWQATAEVLERHLAAVRLEALAARQEELEALRGPMYFI